MNALATTSTSPLPPGVVQVRMCMLRVMAIGGTRAANVVLGTDAVSIGREGHVKGPLALADTEVSRLHAIVAPTDDGWEIVDQGSHNGTFVDGQRTERTVLHHGAVIRAGKTLVVFVAVELGQDQRLAFAPSGSRMVGDSVQAMMLHAELELVALQSLAVLVEGETGTGKELVAEEIHRRSRRSGAFIAVNCAAIAPELAESELFGHVAGAFTGASRGSDGVFVAAEGGTLFLDEVGELPPDLQPKLLRALATGEIRAVGSATARTVDVRVIAATLRDLDREVRDDRFRADLLNRLAGWRLTVSPLRERRDDIVVIASAFLQRHDHRPLTVDAAEALVLHDWPGNVRELQRTLTVAAVRASAARSDIELAHLPAEIAAHTRVRGRVSVAPSVMPMLPLVGAAPSRTDLCTLLERMDGNIARVADHFGKDRAQIYRWAKRYDIDLESFRREP